MPISSIRLRRKSPFWITASASGIGPRGIDVAADDQQAPDAGFAGEPPHHILQSRQHSQPPRCDMDDRFEPHAAQRYSSRDGFIRGSFRHRRKINRRPWWKDVAQLGNLAPARPCGLDRESRAKALAVMTTIVDHACRREITKDSSVEPQTAVLLQHLARALPYSGGRRSRRTGVRPRSAHVDRGVPGGEQRRGADRG